jgi:hypothetical protein
MRGDCSSAPISFGVSFGSLGTFGPRHAVCHARKRARAFFPSLAASAMLSKKIEDRSTGTVLQGQ